MLVKELFCVLERKSLLAKTYCQSQSGQNDFNLRPGDPKAQEMFFKGFVRTIAVIGNLSDHG